MKKVLALVLAVVLAFGMSSVAFAKTTYHEIVIDDTAYYTDKDGKIDGILGGTTMTPGETYYLLVDAFKSDVPVMDSGDETTKLSDLNSYKISYTVEDGKNMIESVKFVSTKYDGTNVKQLAIAIKIKDNFIMESQDINMTVKVTSKDKNAIIIGATGTVNSNYDVIEIGVDNLTAFYNDNDGNDVDNGYFSLDGGAVLTFAEDADDVTLMYDKDVEVAGNMKGQKKIFTRLDTSNTAIEDKFPDATIRFFAGDKDTFRRDVTVTIPYDSSVEKPFLYAVDSKGVMTKLIGGNSSSNAAGETNIKYDDAIGAFVFKTKTLGNYVISDTELKGNVSSGSEGETNTDAPVVGDKPTEEPNPGTGANDFVGLAVALAVVSVAGIAVAKRK